MHSRRTLPRGLWSSLLVATLALPVVVSTARAEGKPRGAVKKEGRSDRPPFVGIQDPDERRSAFAAWKAQKNVIGGSKAISSVTAPTATGIVGRASMVINTAGTVVYTKNLIPTGSTCDVNDPEAQANWQATHAFVAGDVVSPTGAFGVPNGFQGFNFQANNSATSGAVEPTWPAAIGATVVDGGVTWTAIGFDPHEFVGCTPMQLVSRASGGAETVIAQEADTLSDGSQLAGWAEFIAMNASGKAAFRAALAGYQYTDRDDEGESGIFTAGPGAGQLTRVAATNTTIGGRSVCGLSAMVGINDAGQVVFDTYSGLVAGGSECDEDNHGIVRFSSGPGNELLVQQGSTVGSPAATVVGFGSDTPPGGGVQCFSPNCKYQNIDGFINSSGHVPVVLRLSDGTQGVFIFTGPGAATQVVRLTAPLIGPRVSINTADQVVYRANTGGADRLFRFTPPSTTVTIVSVGDVVNGHTISSLGAFTDINSSGNVVFGGEITGGTLSAFYFWNGATVTEIATGPVTAQTPNLDSLASEMITVNDSNTVAYVTGTTGRPDLADEGAEGHEADNVGEGLFTWTSGGGSQKAIANGDVIGGFTVSAVYAQHTSFARRLLNSSGCLAMEYFVGGDDAEQDCTEGDSSAGCYANGSGILFLSCGAVCPTITLAPPTLPGATQGTAYNQLITASGGAAPYTFTETGALPNGITLTAGGTLAGTPTVTGTFPITVTATDVNACTGVQAYSLVVGGPTQVTVVLNPPSRTVVVGGTATLTVSINIAQATDTIVTLTSGNTGIVTVPATTTILAGQTTANFLVTAVSVGGPVTITAALPASFGAPPATASITVLAVATGVNIPTLNPWGFAILGLALAAAALLLMKR